jgi:hypothetical protein
LSDWREGDVFSEKTSLGASEQEKENHDPYRSFIELR